MKKRNWIIGGIAALGVLGGIAVAQIPTTFITTLLGTEQINAIVPATGTVVTNPQIQAMTVNTLKTFIDGLGNGVNAQTGTSYTFVAADAGKLVTASNTGSQAYTLPQAGTAGFLTGSIFSVQNINTGVVTITPTTSTINGSATYVVEPGRGLVFVSDGTNYQVQTGGASLQATPAAISEGGTGSATAATARTALAVPGLATANIFTGTLNTFGTAAGVPGHIASAQTTKPSVATCGTGAAATGSTDTAGSVVATGATACTVSFNVAYTSAPFCVATDVTTAAGLKLAPVAATGFTVTGLTSGDTFNYICIGQSGG
jgi:hypothetical protein